MMESEIDRNRDDCQGSQRLSKTAATHFAREFAGDPN
jgi:hypothetical protein